MELRNDPRIYSGGAVTFNSSPSVNFYAQLLAKKQAKEEAIDEYVRGLNKSINPAGVRNVDRDAFNALYNDFQNYAIQNRDDIRKRRNGADMQLQVKHQNLLNFLNESKQAEEEKKPATEILIDPKKRELVNDNFMKAISAHDQPIYVTDATGKIMRNPNRQRLDYTSEIFNPTPYDFNKSFKAVSEGMQREKIRGKILSTDPVTGTVNVEYEEKYTPDQVKQIAANFVRSVNDNPKSLDYYNQRLEKIIGTKEYEDLNKIYNQVFGGKTFVQPDGKIIEPVIDSPEKLAAAESAKQAISMTSTGTERVLNRELANQRAINNIYFNKTGSGGIGSLSDYDIFGKYTPMIESKTTELLIPDDKGKIQKVNETVQIIPANKVSPRDKELLGKNVLPIPGNRGGYYIVREDGNWEGARGQIIYREDVARSNMDRVSLSEEKRGYTSGSLSKKKAAAIKTYKVNGYDYTEQEIIDAAKQLGMTKEAYMKKYGIK